MLAKLDDGSVDVWLQREHGACGKVLGHGTLHSGVRLGIGLAEKGILYLAVDLGAAAVVEFSLRRCVSVGNLLVASGGAPCLGPFSIRPVDRLDQIRVVEGEGVWSNAHHRPMFLVQLSHS